MATVIVIDLLPTTIESFDVMLLLSVVAPIFNGSISFMMSASTAVKLEYEQGSDDKDSTFIASYPSSIPKIEDQVIGVVLFGERGTKNPPRHVNPDAISISAVYSLDDCDMWWTKVINISSKWT